MRKKAILGNPAPTLLFTFPAGNGSSGDWVVSGWKVAGQCGAVAADVRRRISWWRRDLRRLTSAATTTLEKPTSSPPGVERFRAEVFRDREPIGLKEGLITYLGATLLLAG